ncbi:3'-5' ssDNA/RNA exonuclease TatD-like isoform X2 [Uloborus diversus]|uniref:3'-5' ssDNA/RNA exonuclease TatD-like isoform X2 n=1 Tax=Uloborus diversus TaxID=327109 RepID=UPI002409E981|nr:3'-5' ssDNA/RNA exonuclease TatD-like isoform X2 [Uloborus diversus]
MNNLCNQTLKDDVKRSAYDTSADFSGAILESLDGQYFITDVCANLTNKKFARDVDCVIQRAQNAGVKKIIVSGTNIQTSKEALRLTRLFPDYIYCAAGVHPNDAKTWDDDVEVALREIISNPECKAIGQCGLDFAKSISEPHEQKDVLKKQVQLAVELKKPILICEKDAHSDLVELLKSNVPCLPEIVIHSFSGKIEELQTYLSLGCYIGLNDLVIALASARVMV